MKILVIGNVGFDLMAPYLRWSGIETVLADATGNALNADLADVSFPLDPDGWEPLAEAALAHRVDAVLSISGPDQRNLRDSRLKGFLEAECDIPTLANPPAAAAIAVDKAATKEWLRERGFPVTEGRVARNSAEARVAMAELDLPIVVKSLCESGGVGMRIVEKAGSVRLSRLTYPVLLEKFVSGAEFSVEVLNYAGTAIPLLPVYKGSTNREGIHPMERVKLAPAPIDELDMARLRGLAKEIVSTLDLQPTADVDFVWGKDGPQVLEINPRFGGVTALSMASSGIPSYVALVDMITGRWSADRYKLKRALAADMPIGPMVRESTIRDLLKIEGVFRVKFQKLKKTIGRVALSADDPQSLLDIAGLTARSRVCHEDSLAELRELLDLAFS